VNLNVNDDFRGNLMIIPWWNTDDDDDDDPVFCYRQTINCCCQ